jgi:hypothetical protein
MNARTWLANSAAVTVSILALAVTAHASESRGFVVSWFYPAMNSQEGDCGPDGINPRGDKIFEGVLKARNMSSAEIQDALRGAPDSFPAVITERGTIDGKPVNIYLNPTAAPDPNIKTAKGKKGYGFNLDAKEGAEDFIDLDTGERGADNMLSRVVGCFESFRGTPTVRPSYPAGHWAQPAEAMRAWVIQVSGVDNWRNDDDVNVGVYRAVQPIVRGLTGEPVSDMTFRIDPNPNAWNEMHARIKDGMLVTEPMDFHMTGDPYGVSYYEFREARLRMKIAANGTAQALLGGYFNWLPLYMNFALGGAKAEATLSVDLPGMYYALRRNTKVDAATGDTIGISAAYKVEAIPAFLIQPDTPPTRRPSVNRNHAMTVDNAKPQAQ